MGLDRGTERARAREGMALIVAHDGRQPERDGD
jgi:hypothetical protein